MESAVACWDPYLFGRCYVFPRILTIHISLANEPRNADCNGIGFIIRAIGLFSDIIWKRIRYFVLSSAPISCNIFFHFGGGYLREVLLMQLP